MYLTRAFTVYALQPFFIGGGTYPTSVLAGFGSETLSTAFNVSKIHCSCSYYHRGWWCTDVSIIIAMIFTGLGVASE